MHFWREENKFSRLNFQVSGNSISSEKPGCLAIVQHSFSKQVSRRKIALTKKYNDWITKGFVNDARSWKSAEQRVFLLLALDKKFNFLTNLTCFQMTTWVYFNVVYILYAMKMWFYAYPRFNDPDNSEFRLYLPCSASTISVVTQPHNFLLFRHNSGGNKSSEPHDTFWQETPRVSSLPSLSVLKIGLSKDFGRFVFPMWPSFEASRHGPKDFAV